uniref:ubiquitinyl hydrolase 1 n=1 Tax=Macrostomum lignano TaxID=282301 RepID=A0A1I8FGX4_9PLAT
DCLEAFLQPEQLTGACQWLCPACHSRQDATKQLDVWRLPPCLLVHLKRFCGYDGGKKISSLVEVPGCRPWISIGSAAIQALKSNRRVYNLYGVCKSLTAGRTAALHCRLLECATTNHSGTVSMTTKCRKLRPDNVVSAVQSYILFYTGNRAKRFDFF